MWYLLATKERVLFCFAQIPLTQVLFLGYMACLYPKLV